VKQPVDATIQWLLDGDPAIRWQTLRDLVGASERAVAQERSKVASDGWGARLLATQDADGTWAGGLSSDGGLYSPKWTSTTYTMLLLRDLGLAANDRRARKACGLLLDRGLQRDGGINTGGGGVARRASPEWCCPSWRISGREFLLAHRLFRSHRTGRIIKSDFTRFVFPPRWHYDILRALDYFQAVDAPRDPRLSEAIDIVRTRRREDGRWSLEYSYKGKTYFQLDRIGMPSRWNTLRARRVLKWWDQEGT
jgi:hypothetical protein